MANRTNVPSDGNGGIPRKTSRKSTKSSANPGSLPLSFTLEELVPSWLTWVGAQNRSIETVKTYATNMRSFIRWLDEETSTDGEGDPTSPGTPKGDRHLVATLTERVISAYLVESLATRTPNTAKGRWAALRSFFTWCHKEGEIDRHPMEFLGPPTVPIIPPHVFTDEEVAKLLAVVKGKSFDERRDNAILRLFMDTGMRRKELTRLLLSDIDLKGIVPTVAIRNAKGDKFRLAAFTASTAVAYDSYLRARQRHPAATSEQVWLGKQGAIQSSGAIYQIVERRAKQAGVLGVHPHAFRHLFAHEYLAAGGQVMNLMKLAGWENEQMLRLRYGAALLQERALEEYQRTMGKKKR